MTWNVPNALTLLRIALIPLFVLLFLLPWNWGKGAACAVFIIASLTDFLDGLLARHLQQESNFGEFLDPVADKLMVATALILLVRENHSIFLILPAIIIVGREITVSALREWMAELGQRDQVMVSWIGKTKSAIQMISLAMLIYHEPLHGFPTYAIGMILLYAASFLTLWSMIRYLQAAWPELRE